MLFTRPTADRSVAGSVLDRSPSASHGAVVSAEHFLDRMVWDVEHGRFERALSGLSRLDRPGPLRFFTTEEEPTLRAFCDTVLAQDCEPRVPVVEMVDTKLAEGKLDGYQYADMPDDRDTWRLVLRGLDHTATQGCRTDFAGATESQRDAIVSEFAHGRLVGGAWDELNVTRAWSVVMRAALSEFYSHPWAWNEIGFGGPAYPRGFMRLGGPGADGAAVREPFEKPGATDEDPVRVVDTWQQ